LPEKKVCSGWRGGVLLVKIKRSMLLDFTKVPVSRRANRPVLASACLRGDIVMVECLFVWMRGSRRATMAGVGVLLIY
jgi:hypothetical protein